MATNVSNWHGKVVPGLLDNASPDVEDSLTLAIMAAIQYPGLAPENPDADPDEVSGSTLYTLDDLLPDGMTVVEYLLGNISTAAIIGGMSAAQKESLAGWGLAVYRDFTRQWFGGVGTKMEKERGKAAKAAILATADEILGA